MTVFGYEVKYMCPIYVHPRHKCTRICCTNVPESQSAVTVEISTIYMGQVCVVLFYEIQAVSF